jgi:hypothetical protein
MKPDAFYAQLILALRECIGIWKHASPEIRARFVALSPAQEALRNNTVIGILCLITHTTANLDRAGLFRDLRISNWDPEERARVSSIIENDQLYSSDIGDKYG